MKPSVLLNLLFLLLTTNQLAAQEKAPYAQYLSNHAVLSKTLPAPGAIVANPDKERQLIPIREEAPDYPKGYRYISGASDLSNELITNVSATATRDTTTITFTYKDGSQFVVAGPMKKEKCFYPYYFEYTAIDRNNGESEYRCINLRTKKIVSRSGYKRPFTHEGTDYFFLYENEKTFICDSASTKLRETTCDFYENGFLTAQTWSDDPWPISSFYAEHFKTGKIASKGEFRGGHKIGHHYFGLSANKTDRSRKVYNYKGDLLFTWHDTLESPTGGERVYSISKKSDEQLLCIRIGHRNLLMTLEGKIVMDREGYLEQIIHEEPAFKINDQIVIYQPGTQSMLTYDYTSMVRITPDKYLVHTGKHAQLTDNNGRLLVELPIERAHWFPNGKGFIEGIEPETDTARIALKKRLWFMLNGEKDHFAHKRRYFDTYGKELQFPVEYTIEKLGKNYLRFREMNENGYYGIMDSNEQCYVLFADYLYINYHAPGNYFYALDRNKNIVYIPAPN